MFLELTFELVLAWSAAAVLVLAFLLSAAFHRGRAALAALVLLWAWAGLAMGSGVLAAPAATLRIEAVLLGAPLDLLLLACIVETVVLSRTGALLAGLLVLQSIAAWLPAAELWDLVWRLERLPARWIGEAFGRRGLPPPGCSLFIGVLAAAIASIRAWRSAEPVLAGLALAALVAGWLGYGLLLVTTADWPLLAAGLALIGGAGWASYRMAFLDALTGLPGRRMLDERLARLGRRWAVAMIDVDHFKKFNDRYGHDVGDQVLRMVASELRSHFGPNAFRYGGEEFSVVFPGRTEREARLRCEVFREDIAGRELILRGPDRPAQPPPRERGAGRKKVSRDAKAGKGTKGAKGGKASAVKDARGAGQQRRVGVSVTVSVGIARRSAKQRRPEAVLKGADVALYAAKKGGRNQVVEHGER
ncbi:MAG: GGDEF domain-containing protein [Pseudomonadales bacterium]|jgi:GGDEF domain-containing protein|nr:GGDEF domain-containing protein [Pseudomonadales bacterium]